MRPLPPISASAMILIEEQFAPCQYKIDDTIVDITVPSVFVFLPLEKCKIHVSMIGGL